jgi:hypothetical protein
VTGACDPDVDLQKVVGLRDEQTRFSYLHLVVVVADPATEKHLVPFVHALSNAGVELDAMDCRQRTALNIAVVKKLCAIVAALLRCGCEQSTGVYRSLIAKLKPSPERSRLADTFDRFSPGLWSAVASRDLGIVHILVNSWCRINLVRKLDDSRTQTLIGWAREVGASRDLIGLLEGYEMTLELVHATLAGDRDRMLQLLMDSRHCDLDIMDISHQDDWSSPLRPRSLCEAAEDMGHVHVLDLLTAQSNPTNWRRLRNRGEADRRTVVAPSNLPPLNLSITEEVEMTSAAAPSRSRPQYQSLREGHSRRTSHRRKPPLPPTNQETEEAWHGIDHIATPRGGPSGKPFAQYNASDDPDLTPKAVRKFNDAGVQTSTQIDLRLDLTQVNGSRGVVGVACAPEDGETTPTGDMPNYSTTTNGGVGSAMETPPTSNRSSRRSRKNFTKQAKKIHSTACTVS